VETGGKLAAPGEVKVAEACLRRLQKPAPKSRAPDRKLRSIRLTLDGYPESENLGVLIADQQEYFAAARLNVEVSDPVDSDNVPEYLAQGAIEVGILPLPEVVMAQENGMPLVAISSLVRRPTMAMISLRDGEVDGVGDLEGKTIAINGLSFEERFLQAILKRAGLGPDDIEVRSVAYGLVSSLVGKRADAIFGRWDVEGAELEACGLEPLVTPVQRLGIPPYEELVAVVRRDRLFRSSSWLRPFTVALTRGAKAAAADPRAAAEAIAAARREVEAPFPQNPELTTAKVEATLPLLSRTGRISPALASNLVDWMHGQG
jgi:putative hydroxymethylpyrimidine transport system substrate-binding protein